MEFTKQPYFPPTAVSPAVEMPAPTYVSPANVAPMPMPYPMPYPMPCPAVSPAYVHKAPFTSAGEILVLFILLVIISRCFRRVC